MRCVAVIEAERPGLDSVIIWEADDRLIAFAYLDGRVKMTRPFDTFDVDAAIAEVRQAFQIGSGQLARVHSPVQRVDSETIAIPLPRRWG